MPNTYGMTSAAETALELDFGEPRDAETGHPLPAARPPAGDDFSEAAAAWRHTYAERWARGVCVDCGTAKPPAGRVFCQACGLLRTPEPS